MTEQLSLIPEKLITPKARKVVLTDLPEDLIGPEPEPEFIDSIRKFGCLQPIVLLEHDNIYQVACGRRRIRAARALGLISIPAQIYPLGWTPASVLTLIENTHRKDNLPAQLDAIATLRLSATPEEICTAVGITHQELNQAVKMPDALVPELRDAMKEGRIKTTTAKQAAKLPVEQQRELAERETIKSKDVAALQKQNPTVEQSTNLLPTIEINYGDRIRGQTKDGELLEGIADKVGNTFVILATGEILLMETVELLQAEGGLAELAALENSEEPLSEGDHVKGYNPEANSDVVGKIILISHPLDSAMVETETGDRVSLQYSELQRLTVKQTDSSGKVARQSWKLEAKGLVQKLLAIVPDGEETRQYLELVADALRAKA
jgi:ParB/RepB/Spo0J family partition protein